MPIQNIDENKKAVAVFDEMAETYQQKYMDVGIYTDALEEFWVDLPAKASILDLACGPGNILKFLSGRNPRLQLYGFDLSENMLSLAKENVPSAQLAKKDCRTLHGISEKYDAIVCNFLIPYLNQTEVESLLFEISRLIEDDGRLLFGFISAKENRSELVHSSRGDEIRMYYYSQEFIIRLLQGNGFRTRHMNVYTSPNPNQPQKDIIIVAQKRTAVNFSPFPVLKTDRLTLRELVMDDASQIFRLRSDSQVNQYLGRVPAGAVEDALRFIEIVNENTSKNESLYWAISFHDSYILIGTVCLFSFSAGYHLCEFGYELLPEFQGRGIMKEAAESVIRYAFQTLHIREIEAFVHKDNHRSIKLLEQLSFLPSVKPGTNDPVLICYRLVNNVKQLQASV